MNPETETESSIGRRAKRLLVGRARSLQDTKLFQHLSLIAIFAWVGLGADGLSSSCYGPAEAFVSLGKYHYLGIFVALGTAFTIAVISTSYSQTIELFPTGGGGYLVASKLHSPTVGMVSGCTLLIDYILTISISIASGADALFSFFPAAWQTYKLGVAILGVLLLILLNLRGVKESVLALAPIFLIFVLTHLFVIIYASVTHLSNFTQVAQSAATDVSAARTELGLFGMIFLILKAYSMGAGTFTGIEAVSNGLPILREPRVRTGKRTMRLMATSLAVTAFGLMTAFFLYRLEPQSGKTVNAVLFEQIATGWGSIGTVFVLIILLSEAALLFVAAQAGFIDGPRILANMALDRWMPGRFATLSDRLVTQNGILIMGVSALIVLILSHGQFEFLIVLYSINVFITFILTESGMVRHWWQVRTQERRWKRRLSVNGIALVLDIFILITVIITKFYKGGWITLAVTALLVIAVLGIRRHYHRTGLLLRKLDDLVRAAEAETTDVPVIPKAEPNPKAKTAVLFVNGFNGLGLHTLFSVLRLFPESFKNFAFFQVGVIDAGNFKGIQELENLKEHVKKEVDRYVSYMKSRGYYAEGFTAVGIDVVDEAMQVIPKIRERFPQAIFFGGQLAFPKETFFTRLLHNNIVFAVQRQLYHRAIPFFILPIKV